MRYRLRIHDGVPKYVARAARGVVPKLAAHVRGPGPVRIDVVAGDCLEFDGEIRGFGGFAHPDRIWVAGIKPVGRDIDAREWASQALPMTIAHELAHYEQFVRGGEAALSERGVDVRARSLLREIGLDSPTATAEDTIAVRAA